MLSKTRPLYVCPECQTAVKLNDINCPSCGVNLALAAVRAERQLLSAESAAPTALYDADLHLPRLGELLVKDGDITEAQLEAALARQKTLAAQSWQKTIGQILLEMGAVTREHLDVAIQTQLRGLQEALQESAHQAEQQSERAHELEGTLEKLNEFSELQANFLLRHSQEFHTLLIDLKTYTAALGDESVRAVLTTEQRLALESFNAAIGRLSVLADELSEFSASAGNSAG